MIIRDFKPKDSNNPFTKWSINHLSANKINQWRENPSNFLLNNILKMKQPPSLKMFMGSSSEDVLKKLLFGEIDQKHIDKESRLIFQNKTTLIGTYEDKEKIIKEIIGYKGRTKTYKGQVRNAYELLKGFGKPDATQRPIKFQLKNFPVNVIGYKDFSYDNIKRDVDLKTSGQAWSKVPRSACVQMAIYKLEDQTREQNICFVTKEKSQMYVLEDSFKEYVEEIYYTVNSMAIALTECNSVEDLMLRYMPDLEFWKFSNAHVEKLKDLLKITHQKTFQDIIEQREFERGIS